MSLEALERPFLEGLIKLKPEEDSLSKLRRRAWERFLEVGLPPQKNGTYDGVKLRSLYATSYTRPTIKTPSEEVSDLVFVDGVFSPSLSKSTHVLPLSQGLKTFGSYLNLRWGQILREEKDAFALLNAALFQEGAFLYLPPHTSLTLHLHHLFSGENHAAMPRLHIVLGRGSSLKLLEHKEPSSFAWCTQVIDVSLEEKSLFTHYRQESSVESAWHLDAFRATLKRDAFLEQVTVTKGGKTHRFDAHVSLQGEGAEASLYGIALLEGKNEVHTHIHMEHAAPHTTSNQLFKSVLSDTSRSHFEGKIYVHPEAQKTQAYQMNKNLLLSEKATAHTKPNLEIFADDVKASHGATVGQLDKDLLFYLKSRGLAPQAARRLLIGGFVHEVLSRFPPSFVLETSL